jgi:hypothetical protein
VVLQLVFIKMSGEDTSLLISLQDMNDPSIFEVAARRSTRLEQLDSCSWIGTPLIKRELLLSR